MHRGKKRTVTEDFHNPSSLSSSHFYERTRHKIPSTWTLFASRNKKTRWAVTRWKTKRSRREQKSHGHYPRPAGGRNDIRRETNEERTMKEEIHWTMQKGKIEWYMRQEGRSRKRSTNRKVDTEVEMLRQIKRVRMEDRKKKTQWKERKERRERGGEGGREEGEREECSRSRYFMKPCNFRRNVQWQWSRVYITSTLNQPPSTGIRRRRRSWRRSLTVTHFTLRARCRVDWNMWLKTRDTFEIAVFGMRPSLSVESLSSKRHWDTSLHCCSNWSWKLSEPREIYSTIIENICKIATYRWCTEWNVNDTYYFFNLKDNK